MWHQATDRFQGYYFDFQLPFTRTSIGFDTFDLELDIVIDPQFNWVWKDESDYHQDLRSSPRNNRKYGLTRSSA
jgi:hypothetical protein